jgi:hypothetical protein
MRPVDQIRRHPITITVLVLLRAGVVDRVGVLGFGDHRRCLLGEPGLATVGINRRIRCDLGAVDRDRAKSRQAGLAGDHQDLAEQIGERILVLCAEPCNRRVIGNVLRA